MMHFSLYFPGIRSKDPKVLQAKMNEVNADYSELLDDGKL